MKQLEKTQSLTAADLFQGKSSPLDFVNKIREEVTHEVFDITTDAGRKRCKSQAAKVAKTKTAIDKVGKKLSDELNADAKKVVAKRKIFRDELDKIRDDVREPVTEWEAKQAAIAAKIKYNQDKLHEQVKTTNPFGAPLPIRALEITLVDLRSLEINDESFGENCATFTAIRFAGIVTIQAAIQAIKDAEELAALKRENEERKAKQAADAEKARIQQEAIERHKAEEATKAEDAKVEKHIEGNVVFLTSNAPTPPPLIDVMNPGRPNIQKQIDLVREWGTKKGITGPAGQGTEKGQLFKLLEEVEELVDSHHKNDHDEKIDAIGDCTVVLILLADIIGVSFEDCLETAYQVISKRDGSMVNGQFVKNTD